MAPAAGQPSACQPDFKELKGLAGCQAARELRERCSAARAGVARAPAAAACACSGCERWKCSSRGLRCAAAHLHRRHGKKPGRTPAQATPWLCGTALAGRKVLAQLFPQQGLSTRNLGEDPFLCIYPTCGRRRAPESSASPKAITRRAVCWRRGSPSRPKLSSLVFVQGSSPRGEEHQLSLAACQQEGSMA